MFLETSQLLSKANPKTPNLSNAGLASAYRRMKKYAISSRTRTASAVRPQRINRSGSRASGGRSRTERPPPTPVRLPASMGSLGERLSVAGEPLHLGLGRGVDGRGKRRVLELLRHVLAVALGVVQPVLHPLRDLLRLPRLAHVLVDEEERGRRDGIRAGSRRVDRAEAQVGRDFHAVTRRRGGLQRGRHVLAGLVLHVRGREVVLQGERLLDVAHRALVLLDAGGHAVVALRAG